jgi:hypothetical protein
MVPKIQENIKRIKIAKCEGLELDLSERSISHNNQNPSDKDLARKTVFQLVETLKEISENSDLVYVFGCKSKRYGVHECSHGKGNPVELMNLHREITNDIRQLWE